MINNEDLPGDMAAGLQEEHAHGGMTKPVEHSLKKETTFDQIDEYLTELKAKQKWWAQEATLDERIELLEQVVPLLDKYKKEWAELDGKAKNIPKEHWDYPTGYIGPLTTGLYIHIYTQSLESMKQHGVPKFYSKVEQIGDQVRIQAVPSDLKESIVLNGIKGYVYLQPGTTIDGFHQNQAKIYRDENYEGGVSLVLGAGNYSHLTMSDSLHKLFTEKKVVICKIHPVLDYLYELLNKIFDPFIQAGIMRFVRGGADVGKHLTQHPLVDDIHMTGSDKTFEAIVYGTGEEGLKNKKNDNRINNKPVTGELGCVSPVIVMPGEWSDSDIEYQAKNIVSMLGVNEGYTCAAPRLLILPKKWEGSKKLLNKMKELMHEYKLASNFYPGTEDRIQAAEKAYPDTKEIGEHDGKHQPWIFVTDLDPEKEEYAFENEIWAAFLAQLYLNDDSVEDYLKNAVEFSNTKLWGTLTATIIVDPKTEKVLEKSGALQEAIRDLRYGTVAVNIYSAMSDLFGVLPWGGYPGSKYNDIQSGNGYVNNALFLEDVEKSYLHAPFRIVPEPAWFITNKRAGEVTAAFANFTINYGWSDLAKMLATAIGLRKQEF